MQPMKQATDDPSIDGHVFISRTGTFHVERNLETYKDSVCRGRVMAVYGFSIWLDDPLCIPKNPAVLMRDCEFCLGELAVIKERAERELAELEEAPDLRSGQKRKSSRGSPERKERRRQRARRSTNASPRQNQRGTVMSKEQSQALQDRALGAGGDGRAHRPAGRRICGH